MLPKNRIKSDFFFLPEKNERKKKKNPIWNAQFRLLNTSCWGRESIYYNRNSFLFPVIFKFEKKKVKIKSTLCFSKIGSTRDSVNILHFKTSMISRGPLVGTTVGFLLQACVWPRWVILCWYCCLLCQSLWAPSLPPWSFPLTLLHQEGFLAPAWGLL